MFWLAVRDKPIFAFYELIYVLNKKGHRKPKYLQTFFTHTLKYFYFLRITHRMMDSETYNTLKCIYNKTYFWLSIMLKIDYFDEGLVN